jgi:type I restriction enzyme R subunit
LLDSILRDKEQVIDHSALDNVTRAEWEGDAEENAKAMVQDFEAYLEENRDEIEALSIFYKTPHRRQNVTYAMIKEVLEKLRADKPRLTPLMVWRAYAHVDDYKGQNPASELTAIVSLIRRACGINKTIARHSDTVRRNFQDWIMEHHSGSGQKFNKEQMEWLHMVRDHIVNSFHIEKDDLDMAPFDAYGGMGKMYKLFGKDMDSLIGELNKVLVA